MQADILNGGKFPREIIVKIILKRVDMQEEVSVETLLDNGAMGLAMSSEFAKKQEFKLKKLKGLYIWEM